MIRSPLESISIMVSGRVEGSKAHGVQSMKLLVKEKAARRARTELMLDRFTGRIEFAK